MAVFIVNTGAIQKKRNKKLLIMQKKSDIWGGINVRPIKFRAWDKENEIMSEVEFFSQTVIGIKNAEFEDVENFELMQYTGLKDKNDREIYEGDIITYESVYGGIKTDYVEFNAGSFNPSQVVGWGVHRSVEVIGNIYENPELLEGETNDQKASKEGTS